MPSFDIIKKTKPQETFRVSSVLNAFDISIDKVKEQFTGSIDIEGKDWNVGLIVGASGSGKTTIAKQVFPDSYIFDYEYTAGSVVDDMPKEKSVKEITKAFTSVGFASPPSWLKPYSVLSNGEKMRCDLARAILAEKDMIVFDEFTSVVNREVAKTGSFAIQKAVRKLDKKFIAVSCHSDIVEWLQPEWIYNTDEKRFFFCAGEYRRPEIELKIFKTNKDRQQIWQPLKKYHYLNESLNVATQQWVATINGELVAHTGILQFPMRKGWKRVHRLVVLPDYQGIGIGTRFINEVCKIYDDDGWNINLTTTTPALVHALARDKKWALTRASRMGNQQKGWIKYGTGDKEKNKSLSKRLTKSDSANRVTYSFNWKKDK